MMARGPDGIGEYTEEHVGMAMRRLSVIDLEHGWQPVTSQNGKVIAFQNGEIYNFKELRRDLEAKGFTFRTQSDTEVLAHGYACWGIEGLLNRVDGMYAVAILDRESGALYLARDRFGEKPLFYCFTKERFAYASDLRALASLPWVDDQIDPIALDYYLALHYVPGSRSILRGVKRVLPGQYLRLGLHDLVPKAYRYYRLPLSEIGEVSDDELAEAVERAVLSRLTADVPVGVFLSGGLDSSVVAAIAARVKPRIDTFSMGFYARQHDESAYARQVAQHINSTHHHFLFDESRFAELLPEVALALDEPVGDQATLPLFWLTHEARNHVKVALSGEGADEVFAGYSYYSRFAPKATVWQRLRRFGQLGGPLRKHSDLSTLTRNDILITPSGYPLLTDSHERRSLLGILPDDVDDWEEDLFHWLNAARNPLQRATCVDLATWLPDDLLVKYDRMAMANSLEGRAPYLERNVVELAVCGLRSEDRMARDVGKVALRRIAKRWVPDSILRRPKHGFVLPMRKWIKLWFERHNGAERYFAASSLSTIDKSVVTDLVHRDLENGIRRERLLFALLVLYEWYAGFRQSVVSRRNEYERSYG